MTWKLISKSSYSQLLGELETKLENNQHKYRMTVSEKHLNSGNFAHGGFLMSFWIMLWAMLHISRLVIDHV